MTPEEEARVAAALHRVATASMLSVQELGEAFSRLQVHLGEFISATVEADKRHGARRWWESGQ